MAYSPADNNGNKKVQFSAHQNPHSKHSNCSIPDPLQTQESMPYRPHLHNEFTDSYSETVSPPALSANPKSIEICVDHALRQHLPTQYKAKNVPPLQSVDASTAMHQHNTQQVHHHQLSAHNNYHLQQQQQQQHRHPQSKKKPNPLSMNDNVSVLLDTDNKERLIDQASHPIQEQDSPDKETLINEPSHEIQHDQDEHKNESQQNEDDRFDPKMLPVTEFSSHDAFDHRQPTISNASYDHLPQLYGAVSVDDSSRKPPLPNTASIALSPSVSGPELQPLHGRTYQSPKTSKLSLAKHFSNDVQAFETWMACCDVQDDTFGYYSALYPLLCEIFVEWTQCSRVPLQRELEEVILKHGAVKTKLSKLHTMNEQVSGTIQSDVLRTLKYEIPTQEHAKTAHDVTPPITPPDKQHLATISSGSFGSLLHDQPMLLSQRNKNKKKKQHEYSQSISFDFDHPNKKAKFLVTIKYKSFTKFWKWFKDCCLIIKELAHLWDVRESCVVQCNLFCGREECQQILDQAPQGTFMLRLSSVIRGGIVLSYVEPSFSKKDKHFKHTILIRRGYNEYELRSHAKSKKRRITSISTLVRSFVKIKFLYTPNNLYPKRSIF